MGLLSPEKEIQIPPAPQLPTVKVKMGAVDVAKKIAEAQETPKAEIPRPLTEMEKVQQKWKDDVNEIKDKLELEQLIFDGFVTVDVKLFKGLFTVTYKSLSHEQVADIFSQAAKDTSGESVGVFENYHSLLLISESIQSLNGSDLPTERNKKADIFKKQNASLVVCLTEKYNQFAAAITLLLSDDPKGRLADEIKKS